MIAPYKQRGARFAALLASVALAGCATMAPKYERPVTPVSESFPVGAAYGDVASTGEESAADIGWKDFFADPLLHQLVEKSLTNNRDLRVAALNVEAARARYRVQRSELLPTLSVGAEGTAQKLPSDLFYHRRQYQVGAAVSAWELDLWGRIRSLSDQAREAYFAVEENRTAAQLSLVAEVANAYLTLRADQAMLRLSQDTLATQKTSYDLTYQLVELGNFAKLDLRRTQVALRTAEADVATYTRLAAQDRNALALLLGEPLSPDLATQLDNATTLPDGIVTSKIPAGLPSDLLTRRPDIRAAEHSLKGANASIGAARAAFFPTITLTGSGGTASASLDDLFTSGSGAWSFMPRINLPIFNGGALRANLEQAKVQKSIEIATYEKAIQTAFREVSDGLAGQRTFDDQIKAEQSREAASGAAYKLSEQRFKEGEDSNLALLDAQRAHYGSQQALVRARLARLSNLINLYKALGGGWTAQSIAAGLDQAPSTRQ